VAGEELAHVHFRMDTRVALTKQFQNHTLPFVFYAQQSVGGVASERMDAGGGQVCRTGARGDRVAAEYAVVISERYAV
jgi:hypothetical protein